jgi:hypothetical protein
MPPSSRLPHRARRSSPAGKQDVDLSVLLLHLVVQPVEIREVCDVSAYSRFVFPDLRYGSIQSVLAAAGDEDLHAFCDKSLCGG